ncbi:MAG: response regulator [Pseudobutyrivibrio sp.]|nr:response regulator [Pseudobutyrivibrio sp.]
MKYRALVADDEPMIRRGIKSFVNSYDDFEVVAEAEDGEIALEKARENSIDVYFVDINMPFMNGLEFINELNMLHPEALVVIITGYDVFEYARKALTLGVFEYVLKPIQEEVFQELIEKIRVELSERKQEDCAQKYLEWARNKIGKSRELLVSDLMHSYLGAHITDQEMAEECQYLGLTIPEKYMALLIRTDYKSSDDINNEWNEDLLFFVAENIALETFASLALETKCRTKEGNLVLIIDRQQSTTLDEKIKTYKAMVESYMPVRCTCAYESGEHLGDIPQIYQNLSQQIKDNSGMSEIMSQVIGILESEYKKEDLSLQELAEKVGLSVPYLSRIFRKEAGCTFVDYLTNLRIRKAIALLHEEDLKIYEIAESVGYTSQQYFSLVFKKKIGISPIDYRMSLSAGQDKKV